MVVLHVGGHPAGGQLGHRVGPLDVQPLAAVGTNIFRANVQIFLPGARPGCCPPTGWSRPARSTADDEWLVVARKQKTDLSVRMQEQSSLILNCIKRSDYLFTEQC